MKIIPVIMCGGSGTRLWPISRKQLPKQYLKLFGQYSMLQETILRLDGIENISDPIVICNSSHRFLVAEQLLQIKIDKPTIILEPSGRNTAPAIAAAALYALKQADSILFVLSADHIISDKDRFYEAIRIAYSMSMEGMLSTFGIVPTHPNTGYGYIHKGERVGSAFRVKKFVEKPNQELAEIFLKTNEYLWNSGMFMFKASTMINELNEHSLEIMKFARKSVDNSTIDYDFIRLEEESFKLSPNESIDNAVMEKSGNIYTVPLDAGWADVGSWAVLYDVSKKDNNGNVLKGDVIIEDTCNSYIHSSSRLVVAIGLDDIVVADTPDVTLVSRKHNADNIKYIVEKNLQKNGRKEGALNRKEYRPWGWFDSLESGDNYQVKKLYVNAGSKLSLQLHHKRAEHWVVVSGEATVTKGEEIFKLTKGESTYIPIGTKHSLQNMTNLPLELIEVQSGTYMGEDDIVRFEDNYGRISKENLNNEQ